MLVELRQCGSKSAVALSSKELVKANLIQIPALISGIAPVINLLENKSDQGDF